MLEIVTPPYLLWQKSKAAKEQFLMSNQFIIQYQTVNNVLTSIQMLRRNLRQSSSWPLYLYLVAVNKFLAANLSNSNVSFATHIASYI